MVVGEVRFEVLFGVFWLVRYFSIKVSLNDFLGVLAWFPPNGLLLGPLRFSNVLNAIKP